MTTTDQPLPSAHLTREDVARIEVGHTTVAPSTARALCGCFLVLIAAVPMIELAAAASRGNDEPSAWRHIARVPDDMGANTASVERPGLWPRIVAANRALLANLTAFERTLEDESAIGSALRPPAQFVMTRWLGAGNERVYPGRDGWLFYRPDVEHVTGPPFLDPAELRRRIDTAPEWEHPPEPDPRPAIVAFARDLAARGITLIIMPTPVKPGVHPEMLGPRDAAVNHTWQNPSYETFVADLRQQDVLVFEPSEAWRDTRAGGTVYLATDTHWRPEAVEQVAERLARFIEARAPLPDTSDPGYRIEQAEVQSVGDIALMLDLAPNHQSPFQEAVWLRRVVQPDGSTWRSSRGADVLVLGDSFSNIYSLESMGWGTSAGFVEHLSRSLGRPLDRIVQNDQGAFATRAALQRDPTRLAGTRVVVYQFAVRELTRGDWRVLPIPE